MPGALVESRHAPTTPRNRQSRDSPGVERGIGGAARPCISGGGPKGVMERYLFFFKCGGERFAHSARAATASVAADRRKSDMDNMDFFV